MTQYQAEGTHGAQYSNCKHTPRVLGWHHAWWLLAYYHTLTLHSSPLLHSGAGASTGGTLQACHTNRTFGGAEQPACSVARTSTYISNLWWNTCFRTTSAGSIQKLMHDTATGSIRLLSPQRPLLSTATCCCSIEYSPAQGLAPTDTTAWQGQTTRSQADSTACLKQPHWCDGETRICDGPWLRCTSSQHSICTGEPFET
jgi:hypothetical protein